jgi:anti-sigma B factor antagonist
MLGFDRRHSSESDRHRELTGVDTTRSSSNGARRTGSARAVEVARPRPFAVDVQRRNDVAIVRPHGELDIATVETLRAALDGIENAGRLVLDLRGLSFIDATGLRLMVALHQRAQRDGFQLTLVAPAAPANRALRLSGLDQALPFVATGDADYLEPILQTTFDGLRPPNDGEPT